jgi:hypothetical protein
MELHLELESLGILRQTKVPPELAWMSDAEKHLMLQVFMAGEVGVHKREVQKFERKNPNTVLNLEVRNFIMWETDKSGRPMFLVVTWQGEDAAKLLMHVARHESRKTAAAKAAAAGLA